MTQITPSPSLTQSAGDERSVILACLSRIQRRLWTVRLAERLALALGWAAAVSVPLTASRLLRDKSPMWAAVVAAVALAPAVWLWLKSDRASARIRGLVSPGGLRIAGIITAVVGIAGIVLALTVMNAALATWTIPAAVAAIFVVTAAVSVKKIDTRTAAIFVDQQAGLEERVATALELLEQPAPETPLESAFRSPVVESAVAACHSVKRARVGYQRLDQRAYAIAAVLAIGAAALTLIPALAAPPPVRTRKFVQVVDRAKTMAQALRDIEDKKLPHDEATAEKIKPLQDALTQLKTGQMSPMEAAAALDQARADMERDQKAMEASDNVQKGLKDLQGLGDIAKAADAMKDANMKGAAGDAGAAGQQQAALKAMQDAAQALADKMNGKTDGGAEGNGENKPGMSDAEKNKLASDLKDAAARAGADPQLQHDLERAAGAAQKGDSNELSQNLQSAAQHMAQQSSDRALSQSAVKQAMAQIDAAQAGNMSTAERNADNASGQKSGENSQPSDPQANGGQSPENSNSPQNGDSQANNGQGQNGGKPEGQSGNKPGDGSQPGAGQSMAGSAGATAGQPGESGSTNRENKGGPGDQKEGGPIGKQGTMVQLYDPEHVQTNGSTEKVGGKLNPLGPANGTIDVLGQGDKTKSGIDSYAGQIPGARQRAMDDLNKQEIPPQYQDMIKSFYEK